MTKQVKDFFESHGFQLQTTGGNCSAWVRDNTTGGGEPDGEQTLVTDGDLSAPVDMSDVVRISRCLSGGEEIRFQEFPTVAELMRTVQANFAGYIL